MASLLERFANIQKTPGAVPTQTPMGSTSPLRRDYYGGEAGYQYRRQEEAYGRALRQLRHAARRGDTQSALQEIAVRDQAMNAGFTPGGIRERKAFNQEREAWQAGLEEGAADRHLAADANRQFARETLTDRWDRRQADMQDKNVLDTAPGNTLGMQGEMNALYAAPGNTPGNPLGEDMQADKTVGQFQFRLPLSGGYRPPARMDYKRPEEPFSRFKQLTRRPF